MPEDTKEVNTRRAQLVRLYEANCNIDHPTDNDLRMRDALANQLTLEFALTVARNAPARANRPA